jgi:hypothetical protein
MPDPQQQQQQQQQFSPSSPSAFSIFNTAMTTVFDVKDAAACAELHDVFVAAGLMPSSCRQSLVLALLSHGIGSAAALAAALTRDAKFLDQVAFSIPAHLLFFSIFRPRLSLRSKLLR